MSTSTLRPLANPIHRLSPPPPDPLEFAELLDDQGATPGLSPRLEAPGRPAPGAMRNLLDGLGTPFFFRLKRARDIRPDQMAR